MLERVYLYQCENTLCNNKIYIDISDIESIQLNCTCDRCHDNMILAYEEINILDENDKDDEENS